MHKAGLWALVFASCTLTALSLEAGELEVEVEIPRLNVSEYHRPYVAIWIQDDKQNAVADLAAWYQMRNPQDKSGHQWLPTLRQWWRRSGRSLDLPVDGLSGATRHTGQHKITFKEGEKPLSGLKAGKYVLLVEASREVGGREVLELNFTWPPQKEETVTVKGTHELGTVTLKTVP